MCATSSPLGTRRGEYTTQPLPAPRGAGVLIPGGQVPGQSGEEEASVSSKTLWWLSPQLNGVSDRAARWLQGIYSLLLTRRTLLLTCYDSLVEQVRMPWPFKSQNTCSFLPQKVIHMLKLQEHHSLHVPEKPLRGDPL